MKKIISLISGIYFLFAFNCFTVPAYSQELSQEEQTIEDDGFVEDKTEADEQQVDEIIPGDELTTVLFSDDDMQE